MTTLTDTKAHAFLQVQVDLRRMYERLHQMYDSLHDMDEHMQQWSDQAEKEYDAAGALCEAVGDDLADIVVPDGLFEEIDTDLSWFEEHITDLRASMRLCDRNLQRLMFEVSADLSEIEQADQ
ncbi:MAG: hypothetical protein OXD31_11275 [Chloroflexi bacterium]|nr:hypothetical protein [Chloroflexota bacterium]